MSETWFVKKPCKHCPFRRDVTPFLHPERAAEISELSWNRFNEFHCHKTIGHDDDEGDTVVTPESLACAGFLAMQVEYGGAPCPDGFTIPDNVYSDPDEMTEAYQDEWDKRRSKRTARSRP